MEMMKGLVVDENMSNLTSKSSEISASSGARNDTGSLYPQYSSTLTNQEPQPKKKRTLPGHPDPDAEVIALTPKTLLATNRFICEICNKGFQRDQNLQLHRRGHNLPWKLKQRNSKETRKKVYVCPEPTCVHHDPSRALGDLTGIKKHFCRKHIGEKKWKCEKCSKRYAVQSDWRAHSKICGTREYKCDCGTIFSRRDSFITHRAFCDALAQESARALNITAMSPLISSHHTPLHSHGLREPPFMKREQGYYNLRPEIPPWLAPPQVGEEAVTALDFSSQQPLLPTQLDHSRALHENPNSNLFTTLLPNPLQSTASPHMSATALLQKASQIGATMSKITAPSLSTIRTHLQHHQGHVPADECTKGYGSSSSTMASLSSSVSGMVMHSREEIASGFCPGLASYGNKAAASTDYLEEGAANTEADDHHHQQHHHLESSSFHDVMMGSTVHSASGFEEAMPMRGMFMNAARDSNNNNNNNNNSFQELVSKSTQSQFSTRTNKGTTTTGDGANDDEMTRDFLGLRAFCHRDLFNISGLDHLGSSSYGKQNHSHLPWQG